MATKCEIAETIWLKDRFSLFHMAVNVSFYCIFTVSDFDSLCYSVCEYVNNDT